MKNEMIVVLDFGSQYNQLIARRIRELGVYSELRSHKMTAEEIKNLGNVKGIVLSGGPNSVYDESSFRPDPAIFDLGIPVMGICYGMQYMAHHFGGKVEGAHSREYGRKEIEIINPTPLCKDLPEQQVVWMSHGDHVVEVPAGFSIDAQTDTTPIVMMHDQARKMYAVQFHPEVQHSEHGTGMLKNFIYEVCQATGDWTMKSFVDMQVEKIRKQVGSDHVLCALSGGVDSSVVAALLHKAIGDQLTCLFVDHNLLRKNEAEMVMKVFGEEFNMHIIKVDARERFMSKLAGVSDPEEKRKIIGNEFIYTFDDEQKRLAQEENVKWLAQGTLYTDIVESGTDTAQTIKSHHNVGGLPEDMEFKLIEPLDTLFKDEVRQLGIELGLSPQLVWRQPFPGPGLAIRIIGDVTEEKLHIVRESDAILHEEVVNFGLQKDVWQYFTVLTNLRSVGVMGDQRTYDYTLGIRAVSSIDGMTADFAKLPWEMLQKVSVRIVNEVPGVNRIVYDITSKPPATIEWE
ncbi:MAG: glutamine-hydrolyzing GMP synthase [Culicoidibacterales bacterium]